MTVGQLRALEGAELDYRLAGATFEELSAKQRSQEWAGVVLSKLEQDSRLARAGLRPGDVITGVNGTKIRNLVEFESETSPLRSQLALRVWRQGREYVVRLD